MEPNTDISNASNAMDVHESEVLLINARSLSRAGRRKFNKKIRDLKEALELNPMLFNRRWNRLVQGWLHEIHRRANAWAISDDKLKEYSKSQLIDMGQLEVFEVVDIAESVIEASGIEIRARVGAATVRELKNECVKAIAGVIDQRLNYQIDKKVYRRIKK